VGESGGVTLVDHLPKNLFICVEGLFEKGDSIGFDAIYHWRTLHQMFGDTVNVRLFCARFNEELHPAVPAEAIDELTGKSWNEQDTVIIYHYCDGWPSFEEKLLKWNSELIVRWHNNTPPWFFGRYGRQFVDRTMRGYRRIIALAETNPVRVWCNSRYSARQLEVLGIKPEKLHVVYPASGYLSNETEAGEFNAGAASAMSANGPMNLLFVGRVVPHKGHRHLLATAGCLQEKLGVPVKVICPGRIDVSLRSYADDLRELATKLAVQLSLPGEIDRSELNRLYRDADAFVCLSEHEGFGLPIFEAMRSGLPTIALKQTAVAELIETHPLAFPEFSPAQFAAALATLWDADIRSYVLRCQDENILPQYTHEIVAAQIRQGLKAGSTVLQRDESPDASLPTAFRDEALDRKIKDQLKDLTRQASGYSYQVLSNIPREIPNNYVTRYDLEVYEEFTSLKPIEFEENAGVAASEPVSGGRQGRRSGILIPASRFSTMEGPVLRDAVTVPLDTDDKHLIFGPYIAIPKGVYAVDFQVELIELSNSRAAGALHFDVADSGHLLCLRTLTLAELRAGMRPVVEFLQGKDDALIEFRVSGDRCPGGAVQFRGVILGKLGSVPVASGRLDSIPDIVERARPCEVATLTQMIEKRRISRRRWRMRLRLGHRAAADAFMQADQARDRQDWPQAVSFYGKGLKLDPDHFAMWVQYGHCLKQNGRLAEAEKAYQRAIELCPEDADINLQMGHLLKIQGRLSEAVAYYTRASDLAPLAGQLAREELVRCGAAL
jgi:glycosyltransferase involved in cell wall biosynthesis